MTWIYPMTIHIPISLRMWRMSLANQRNERPHLSNGRPESKPVDCSSYCRNMNCSLQLQRDCCSLQSCCRQATISRIAVYSAGAPRLPNNVSLAGVCSRVHLRGSWGWEGSALTLETILTERLRAAMPGQGSQQAQVGRYIFTKKEDEIKLQVHQPKYKCTTRRFLCLR